jgi:hypothetical protein
MNIFFLDKDPGVAAEYHHDKHVVKMILETAQLLSTAHRVIDGDQYIDQSTGRKIKRWKMNNEFMEERLYKATHINHPSNVWARTSKDNYMWLYRLFVSLCHEYTHRYGKVHATCTKLAVILSQAPRNIPNNGMTNMPQAMPDEYKVEDSVQAYRNYYIGAKKQQSKYTKRDVPSWLI